MCDQALVRKLRRLAWLIALPLMLGGSFTAHAVGSRLISRPVSADADGGHELVGRVEHGAVTLLPLIGGIAIALVVVLTLLRITRALRAGRSRGVPRWCSCCCRRSPSPSRKWR